MDIEVAKEKLNGIDIKFFLNGMNEQSNYVVDKADEINLAIETALNELEKKDKVIDEMAKDILHDRNEWVEFDFEKYKDIEEVKEEYYEKAEEK